MISSGLVAGESRSSTLERPVPGQPMRILLIAPQPFFAQRGTPINVRQMVQVLCEAGHDVHLATYPMGEPVVVPGLHIHRALAVPGVRDVPIGFSWRKIALDLSLALTVWRLLASRRFDVVHAVEESVFFALPAARMRRHSGDLRSRLVALRPAGVRRSREEWRAPGPVARHGARGASALPPRDHGQRLAVGSGARDGAGPRRRTDRGLSARRGASRARSARVSRVSARVTRWRRVARSSTRAISRATRGSISCSTRSRSSRARARMRLSCSWEGRPPR